jgi:uncharacterized protein
MLLSKENTSVNLINAWKSGAILVGEEWLEGHLIISPETIIRSWAVDTPVGLEVGHLEQAVALKPEIILVGTGSRLVLPDADLMQLLGQRGIGIEIMDTPAACRTYNVLAHELRRVVAALFEPRD